MEKKKLTYSEEVFPGIFRIKLPLPFEKPGPVNAYLFLGEKITLLDTGTMQGAKVLKTALAELGLGFSSIQQVVITHGHIEHYGAARLIEKESGRDLTVAAHPEDARIIRKGFDVSHKIYKRYLKMIGVPFSLRQFALLFIGLFKIMSRPCNVNLELVDMDKIKLGDYTATAIHTPGHTKGSLCFHIEKENILFSGDHILKHVTPNAFVMMEPHSHIPVRLSQEEYYKSIERIEQLAPATVYPAHDREIVNLKEITDMYRKNFYDRQKLILSIIASSGMDSYHIARKLFPDIGGKKLPLEIFLAISEVYSHLQVLVKEKRVSCFENNKKFIFRKI